MQRLHARQPTSAYIGTRQHTSTSAYVSISRTFGSALALLAATEREREREREAKTHTALHAATAVSPQRERAGGGERASEI